MKLFARNKKGSLSLSMEAIVILILAVVMLGLALAFIQGMFKNLKDRATNTLDLAEYDLNPTEDKPIVFSPTSPDVKEGDSIEVAVGYFNADQTANQWKMVLKNELGEECVSGEGCAGSLSGSTAPVEVIYNGLPIKIDKDGQNGWLISFNAIGEGTDAIEQYLYTIQFCGIGQDTTPTDAGDIDCADSGTTTQQKQIFLKVRK